MKISFQRYAKRRQNAFTLPEVMVTVVTSIIVVGGVMFSHITGLKMYELVKAKMGASDDTRDAISHLTDEIRTSKVVQIGKASNLTNFVQVADDTLQSGNAIRIFPTSNSTPFIQYYVNTNSQQFIRSFNATKPRTVANYVTNAIAFSSEDFAGNVLSDNEDSSVISVTLNFYQLQYASARAGSTSLADTYRLQTKIARRTAY